MHGDMRITIKDFADFVTRPGANTSFLHSENPPAAIQSFLSPTQHMLTLELVPLLAFPATVVQAMIVPSP